MFEQYIRFFVQLGADSWWGSMPLAEQSGLVSTTGEYYFSHIRDESEWGEERGGFFVRACHHLSE